MNESEFEKWKEIHGWKLEFIRLCRLCASNIDSSCLSRGPGVCQMCGKQSQDTNHYMIGWLISKISGVKFDHQLIPKDKLGFLDMDNDGGCCGFPEES